MKLTEENLKQYKQKAAQGEIKNVFNHINYIHPVQIASNINDVKA